MSRMAKRGKLSSTANDTAVARSWGGSSFLASSSSSSAAAADTPPRPNKTAKKSSAPTSKRNASVRFGNENIVDLSDDEMIDAVEDTGIGSVASGKGSSSQATDEALESWSQEELDSLLTQAQEEWHKKKKSDVLKWTTSLRDRLEWENITVAGKTTEDCKAALGALLKRQRSFRTLSELLSDAKVYITKPHFKRSRHPDMPTQPMGPFFRYLQDVRPRLVKRYPDKGTIEISKLASEDFKKLPTSQKEKYQKAYERAREEYSDKLRQFLLKNPECGSRHTKAKTQTQDPKPPAKPRTPFDMYCLAHLDEGEQLKAARLRLRSIFNVIKEKKRMKWIKRAIKDVERYVEEAEEFARSHPNWQHVELKPNMNARERALIEHSQGVPMKPPASGYALFVREYAEAHSDLPDGKDRLRILGNQWKALTESRKGEYTQRYKDLESQYLMDVRAYLDTLPHDEQIKFLTTNKVPPLDKYEKSGSGGGLSSTTVTLVEKSLNKSNSRTLKNNSSMSDDSME